MLFNYTIMTKRIQSGSAFVPNPANKIYGDDISIVPDNILYVELCL